MISAAVCYIVTELQQVLWIYFSTMAEYPAGSRPWFHLLSK